MEERTLAPDWTAAIDPGLDGAIALFDGANEAVRVIDMPTLKSGANSKREISGHEVLRLLPIGCRVVIERQQAMPKQGGASTFKTGYGYGLLTGLLIAMAYRYAIVSPNEWSKQVGRPSGAGKDWNVAAARRLFPHLAGELLASKDGRADALLIGAAFLGTAKPEPAPAPSGIDPALPDW